jgi:hypothetical protein
MDLTAAEELGWSKSRHLLEGLPEATRKAVQVGFDALIESAGLPLAEESAVAAERWAGEVARKVTRPLLQARLQARLGVEDGKDEGGCAECGVRRESQGLRVRTWVSLFGALRLKRRYLHCGKCQRGGFPAQEALGLTDSDWTPEMASVCTLMSTTVPYGMAAAVLHSLLGVEVSVKALESAVARRATGLSQQQGAEADRCAAFDESGLPVVQQQRPADAKAARSGVAYVELDGVVPMTREEIPRRDLSSAQKRKLTRAKRDKARGGRGRRYNLVGREVKNAVLYRAEDCARESPSRDCILDKVYVSHLGGPEKFAELLWVEMLRAGLDQHQKVVFLSDGAEWIRNLAERLPIKVQLILDLFHVKHRIWEVARLLCGEHSPLTTRWAGVQCDRIEAGQARKVIRTLNTLSGASGQARKAAADLAGYLANNLDRMDYPTYRAQGLRVGSGAVESANFHVTGARLKLQGMRWTQSGAAQMAVLRADLFNDRWQQTTGRLRVA